MKYIVFLLLLVCVCINVTAKNNSISVQDTMVCLSHDTIVRVAVENGAQFQGGGMEKFRVFIARNIKYPIDAQMGRQQGKVYVRFVVDWDGRVKDVSIYKSSGYRSLDNEALRLVHSSPAWKAAHEGSVCVPQLFIVPVNFVSLGTVSEQSEVNRNMQNRKSK